MPGQSTKTKGRGAPAAAASSTVMDPGADDPGHVDASMAIAILEESQGAEPGGAEGDTGQTEDRGRKSKAPKKPATSRPAAADDETATDEDTETEETAEAEEQSEETAAEETETEAEGDEETEETKEESAETEETEAVADTNTDDTPEWAKRRFSEYATQVKELRRELAEARAGGGGNAAPARPAVTPSVEAELLAAETPEQLTELRQRYLDIEDWTDAHRDGIEPDPDKPDAKSFTREQVAEVRTNARRALRALEGRGQQVQETLRFNSAAAQLFPGYKDPDSEESRSAAWILRQVPELKRYPGYRILIGDALAGERARTKAAQAAADAKNGKNGRPLPGRPAVTVLRKVPPAGPKAPVRGAVQPNAKAEARQKVRATAFRTGSEADIARLVEASMG